jgi:hypothetical protein
MWVFPVDDPDLPHRVGRENDYTKTDASGEGISEISTSFL